MNGEVPAIDAKTQLKFTVSQLVQVIVLVAVGVLLYADIKFTLVNLTKAVEGVYTKNEIDRKVAEAKTVHDDLYREIRQIKKWIGKEDE